MALKENLQNYLKKGVQASKEAFSKAETAVTKFGDESVLKIEKKQFEAKLRKEIASLGQSTLDAFEKNISDGDNLRQYRVKVHAMKTSAAMIGALTVSSVAKLLEYAARDEKTDVIKTMHPIFMEQWNRN